MDLTDPQKLILLGFSGVILLLSAACSDSGENSAPGYGSDSDQTSVSGSLLAEGSNGQTEDLNLKAKNLVAAKASEEASDQEAQTSALDEYPLTSFEVKSVFDLGGEAGLEVVLFQKQAGQRITINKSAEQAGIRLIEYSSANNESSVTIERDKEQATLYLNATNIEPIEEIGQLFGLNDLPIKDAPVWFSAEGPDGSLDFPQVKSPLDEVEAK